MTNPSTPSDARLILALTLLISWFCTSASWGEGPDTGAKSAVKRPNILVIMPDDVGIWNVGAYSHGMMAPTPNIDRIAKEGKLFTDHYAQPTCTPGRAAFIGSLVD